jgi:caspase 7
MNHKERGIALVINMQNYDAPNPFKLGERKWSEKDIESLKKTLDYLEFKVILSLNSTKSQIEKVLQEQAELDHSESDCFLCVVMSHGNEDKIVTRDNQEMSFEEIMAPIKLCKTLENKPKLFFFQASRGENEMEIHRLTRSDSVESTSSEDSARDYQTRENTSDSNELYTKKKTSIYAESDLLVYNATLPKHYAFGTEKDGTYFIQSVCNVLNEAYKELPKNMPLSTMILNTNKSVRVSGIQLAHPINNLVADVYFMPKNVSSTLEIFLGSLLINKNDIESLEFDFDARVSEIDPR